MRHYPAIAPDDVRILELSVKTFQSAGALNSGERSDLDIALRRTLIAIHPVTIQTLRDTDTALLRHPGIWSFYSFPTFEARWLSRKMVFCTLAFLSIAVLGDVHALFYGPPLDQTEGVVNLVGILLQVFTPFTYGAIGACVFLLKSLHIFVYERCYDRRCNSSSHL